MTLGQKISSKRKQSNMTQEQLADYLGVSRQAISKWESNTAYPETDKLIKISELFACSLDFLLKDSIESEETAKSIEQREIDHRQTDQNEINLDILRLGGYLRFSHIRERKSEKTMWGMPLWHIGKQAKGVIAIGINARGIIAIGLKAQGIISFGLLSIGVISLGVLSVGLLAIGMIAAGVFACGSIALGIFALGAVSVGIISVGALSIGNFSLGALALGKYIAIGDHAQGMIAIGDTKAVGSVYEHLGEYSAVDVTQIKVLLNEHVPMVFKWFKDIFVFFL